MSSASAFEDEKAQGVRDTTDDADDAISAGVAAVARYGDDRADDGRACHRQPRQRGGVAVQTCLSLVTSDAHDRSHVAVSSCPYVSNEARERVEDDQANREEAIAADPRGHCQGTAADAEDGDDRRSMSRSYRTCHDAASSSSMNMASTVSPKLRAIAS